MPLHSVIYCAFYSTEIIMFYSAPKNISVIGPMVAASFMSGGNLFHQYVVCINLFHQYGVCINLFHQHGVCISLFH